jgi:hypothetical protein
MTIQRSRKLTEIPEIYVKQLIAMQIQLKFELILTNKAATIILSIYFLNENDIRLNFIH